METYRLPYGPNGKAKLSILPYKGGLYFPNRKFINLYIFRYQFIRGPMETYRLPYGPNGKAKLSIWPL